MNDRLKKPFSSYQQRKNAVMERLKKIDENILFLSEKPGKWSVIQVLVHLMESERGSLAYCQKKVLAGDQLPETGLKSALRWNLFRITMEYPVKMKAPAPVRHPSNDLTLDQITKAWEVLEKKQIDFFSNYPDKYLNKGIFKHPVAGRIRLQEMIQFFETHIHHHEHQIDRILKIVS